jgi:hypothetical protein
MFCARWNPSLVHRSAVACDHQYRLGSPLSTSFPSVLEKETKAGIPLLPQRQSYGLDDREIGIRFPVQCGQNIMEISNLPTDPTGDAYP